MNRIEFLSLATTPREACLLEQLCAGHKLRAVYKGGKLGGPRPGSWGLDWGEKDPDHYVVGETRLTNEELLFLNTIQDITEFPVMASVQVYRTWAPETQVEAARAGLFFGEEPACPEELQKKECRVLLGTKEYGVFKVVFEKTGPAGGLLPAATHWLNGRRREYFYVSVSNSGEEHWFKGGGTKRIPISGAEVCAILAGFQPEKLWGDLLQEIRNKL